MKHFTVSKTEGLWRVCYNFKCVKYSKVPGYLKVTRVLAIIGTCLIGIGTLIAIVGIFIKNFAGYHASFVFLLAIFILSATQYIYNHGKDWTKAQLEGGYDYFLCWVATVMCSLCSFYGFCTF